MRCPILFFRRQHLALLTVATAFLLTHFILAPKVVFAESRADSAEGADNLIAIGEWQVSQGRTAIKVKLADLLTSKQKNMISGGFTTVSQLQLFVPLTSEIDLAMESLKDRDGSASRATTLADIFSVRCSVKYDAWLETFDVAQLGDHPQTAVVKEYAEYGQLCLDVNIVDPKVLAKLSTQGGTLLAKLIVKQTSIEEAKKIKEWLIQQQSGMMQGLFSHMLGELTLQQTLTARISVPPQPPKQAAVSPSQQNAPEELTKKR